MSLALGACTTDPAVSYPSSPEGADVLFVDDFSTPPTTWLLFDSPEGAAYARQGELYLEDRGRGIGIYTRPEQDGWDDVNLSVQVRQVEGTQNNWMGVICRQQDEGNYYLFAVSADGYYLILKMADGYPTPLAGPYPNEAVLAGREANLLEVRCEGNTLSLNINDQLLISRTDDSFRRGEVALFADAVGPNDVTTAAFDALVVSEARGTP
jgi:hypothetical protein